MTQDPFDFLLGDKADAYRNEMAKKYAKDPSTEEASFVQKGIENQPIDAVLAFLIEHSPKEESIAAQKLLDHLAERRRNGFRFNIIVTHLGDKAPMFCLSRNWRISPVELVG